MEHLEENTVIGFVAGKLPDAERRRVEEHVDDCPQCRKLLAAMGADSSLLTPYAGTIESTQPAPKQDDPIAKLKAGEIIGDRYTIVRSLGRGGMGYVFQVSDKELQIDVALKMLRPELTRDDEQVRHLRREILAGRAIAHPNACRVFDLGKDDRFYFITMEYVDGVTLEDRMRAVRLPQPQALDLLDTVLSVVAAAHREGIVHRDLKPANLMLDKKDRIKVMDFGLARDLKGETSLVGAVGTPAYWAPEQARGEPAGPAADVFALGVIAYLMLTGAVSTQAITRRLDRVPVQYRAWVAKCLDEEPGERFADAGAAHAAFNVARSTRPIRKRTILIPLIGGGLVVAAAAGYIATRDHAPRPRPQSPANDPPMQPAATPDAALAMPAMAADAAAPSPPDAPSLSPADAGVRARPVIRHDAGTASPAPALKPDAGSLLYE